MGIFSATARVILAPVRLAEVGLLTAAVTADMAAEAAVTTAATVATTAVTATVEAVDQAAHRYLPLPTGHVAGTVVKVYPDGRREVIYSPV